MNGGKLTAATFLAPNMLPVYQFLIKTIGEQLGLQTELVVGNHYAELPDYDLSFVCGLPYILYTHPYRTPSPIEAIAAPVLQGARYQNRPIYFSDVIVHRDSPFYSFADLRGCTWAYNEPLSQSGYGITRYHLLKLGESQGYFGEVIEAGFHQKAIEMVYQRQIDAAAIDSQVLAVELRHRPHLIEQLRIIDTFGPSTIQPLTISTHLPQNLKQDIQAILCNLHTDPAARKILDMGLIDYFVAVGDADYDDIRGMLTACEKADFLSLK